MHGKARACPGRSSLGGCTQAVQARVGNRGHAQAGAALAGVHRRVGMGRIMAMPSLSKCAQVGARMGGKVLACPDRHMQAGMGTSRQALWVQTSGWGCEQHEEEKRKELTYVHAQPGSQVGCNPKH
ncbi:hypothetical protein BJV74DRAFT_796654 [Russula compacta]|nr:hypothetical protein BJV74DRAFT_796654 [Russula compacta]